MTASIYQYGEATPAKLALPPNSWGYDASLESLVPDYDPEGAKQLLAEAGYPDGFTCDLYISNTALREKMATLVQAYLKTNLNVTVNIKKSEWGTFSEAASSGSADMYGMSWTWYPEDVYKRQIETCPPAFESMPGVVKDLFCSSNLVAWVKVCLLYTS